MKTLKQGAHIHLIGICGTAMASLAGLLKSQGYHVTGSDQNVYPPMSTQLKELGIEIMTGYKRENLRVKPDLVIVGNVISRSNEEAQALIESDIPYTSLPKAMGEFAIADRHSIVISGTHGKTTTTSMMIRVADECLGASQAGYMVGGIPIDQGRSFRNASGAFFILEGDEYDTAFFDKVPKFVHYKPRSVILTSVEFDHADIYADLNAVKQAFRMLIDLIPEDGLLVACSDDANVRELASHARCRVVTYGTHPAPHHVGGSQSRYVEALGGPHAIQPAAHYRVVERKMISGRNHFAIEKFTSQLAEKDASIASSENGDAQIAESKLTSQKVADVALKSPGLHNALNATAVYALASELKWPMTGVLQGLANFKGVKRRQEVIGTPRGVTIVEDFAHHPTAVKLTSEAIREQYFGGPSVEKKSTHKSDSGSVATRIKDSSTAAQHQGRLICLFEPRSATSRRKVFQKDYVEAFRAADMAIIAKAFDQSKISQEERFSTDELVRDMKEKGQNAQEFNSADEIVSYLKTEAQKGDVILIMSNGGFDGIYQKLTTALS
jgi:UDP-N-acetylmuramate: L-alanyl-gamma-D-glutamyl-meso-diaminopimelate ligase